MSFWDFFKDFVQNSFSLSSDYLKELIFGGKPINLNRSLEGDNKNNTIYDDQLRITPIEDVISDHGTFLYRIYEYDYRNNFNSLIKSYKGNDTIYALAGNDVVFAGEDNDEVNGGTGNDIIMGEDGDDTLNGESGNDLINGGKGADKIDGGSGTDTASYADSDEGVVVDLSTNQNSGGDADGDVLTSIENIIGSDFDDNLTGNKYANILEGGAGNDTLDGGAGADTLNGGSGDDIYMFAMGSGSDTIIDSDGTIIINGQKLSGTAMQVGTSNNFVIGNYKLQLSKGNLIIKHNKSNVITIKSFQDNSFGINLNYNPTATLIASTTRENQPMVIDVLKSAADADGDALSISSLTNATKGTVTVVKDFNGNQKILYTPFLNQNGTDKFNYTISDGQGGFITKTMSVKIIAVNDPINGSSNDDTLNGNSKNDLIRGNDGNDTINGKEGDDELSGDAGNDKILGGSGKDSLFGGSGDDYLDGGSDADTIYGSLGQDTLIGGAGKDIFVYKFSDESTINTMDIIKDFKQKEDKINLHDLDILNHSITLDTNPNDANVPQGLSYHFDNKDTVIQYHDSNSNQDFAIKLIGHINLTSDDFIF